MPKPVLWPKPSLRKTAAEVRSLKRLKRETKQRLKRERARERELEKMVERGEWHPELDYMANWN